MGYRAGIIGTGGIAGMGILGMHEAEDIGKKTFTASHAGGFDAHDDIDLVAVADVDQEKRDTFSDAWDIPEENRYREYSAMIEAESLDVVSVCTPTYLHHHHVSDVATHENAPSLIWCEKPLASSVGEGKEMIETCDEADVELVINHSFRFVEKVVQLKERLNDGLIGSVESISAQFRRELLRNSTHLLDTITYLFDARAQSVFGYIDGINEAVDALDAAVDVDDAGGAGLIVLDDGTVFTVDCSIDRAVSSMQIDIIGTDGKLSLNNDDGEWRYWSLEGSSHVEQPLPSLDGSFSWEVDYRDAFPNAVEHIVDVLDGVAENRSSGSDANRAMEIIVAMYISHYTGSRVNVPLDRPLEGVRITSW